MSWLQFPVNCVDACPDEAQPNDDEDGNPLPKHPVCTKSLELNADAVAAMLDHFDGKFIEIPTLQREVRALYGLVKYDTAKPKLESYIDAWDLRRLYTFCFRRQRDAAKRGQKPRDPKVRAMFEKIAQLREIWNSESWDESDYPVPGDDDDQYTPADDSAKSSTRAPTATSLASTPTLPATPQSVATKEVRVVPAEDCNALLGEDITAEQDKELMELLLEIKRMEGLEKSGGGEKLSQASAPPCQKSLPALPAPPAVDPTQVDTLPMEMEIATPSPKPAVETKESREKVEVAAPTGVTPSLQGAMRTQQGKSLKRGRKPKNKGKGKGKTGKTGKGHTSPKNRIQRKKSKRSVLKAAKKDGKRSPTKGVQTTHDDSVPPKKKRRSKTSPSETKTDSGLEAGKMAQGRFTVGKGWVYEIIEGQYYGCRSCRFIYGGCGHCQKENFRGVRAEEARKKQQEYPREQYQASTTSSQQGQVKKTKKVKKSPAKS